MAVEAFTYEQWNCVYNALSFGIAGMGAASVFAFFQHFNVIKKYRTALIINGLVTLIATYHYFRIFDSWNAAYSVAKVAAAGDVAAHYAVTETGKPFNDAYRYVDWLLTVPLLLAELVLVMGLSDDQTRSLTWKLGLSSALMVALGYPGEISAVQSTRWIFWGLAMVPFLYVVYTLLVGLAGPPAKDEDYESEDEDVEKFYPVVMGSPEQMARLNMLLSAARYLTAISWCTYPVVYAIKSADVSSAAATMYEQVGYSLADFLAKAVFGVLIWAIASTKSDIEEGTK